MKIYVASSFRNDHLDDVVKGLREDGHEVYDFREDGFGWKEAMGEAGFVELRLRDEKAQAEKEASPQLSAKEWHMVTHTPTAGEAFMRDYKALQACEALVLVLPAGRSAHLEAGFAAAARVTVHIYQPGLERPDLMNRMIESNGGKVFDSLDELRDEMLPGSRYDKATERAARIVERSELAPAEARANLAAIIRARKQIFP